MIIKNIDQLATNPLRQDALEIVNAGLEAVDAHLCVKNQISLEGDSLKIQDQHFDLSKYEKIYLAGIGKVACAVGEVLVEILGEKIQDGMILGSHELVLANLECIVASHPLPSDVNVEATKRLVEQIQQTSKNDLILAVITGGGSSMMCYPNQISCSEESRITHALFEAGASIYELNTVRKHISKVKGGWLASYAGDTDMVALIFSDVPGDDLSLIASGPTVYDESTVDDAAAILAKYDILNTCRLPGCELLETPKDQSIFENVTNIMMVTNRIAVSAMATKAQALGYQVEEKLGIEGEARNVGKELLGLLKNTSAIVAGGETTVVIKGEGKGGRNQELVLGSLAHLNPNQVVISIASDGADLTHFAGAIGDQETLAKAQKRQVNIQECLDNNDSTAFFEAVGDGIETGKLASNVSDLMLVLQKV